MTSKSVLDKASVSQLVHERNRGNVFMFQECFSKIFRPESFGLLPRFLSLLQDINIVTFIRDGKLLHTVSRYQTHKVSFRLGGCHMSVTYCRAQLISTAATSEVVYIRMAYYIKELIYISITLEQCLHKCDIL